MNKKDAILIISNRIYELNVDSDECETEAEKILDDLIEGGLEIDDEKE